jgi:hypothetical protein
MTKQKWFMPVIGFIVAIALGVGIAIVVTQVAPKTPGPVPGETITAPVLAPLDEEQMLGDDYELSAIVGARDVVTPGGGDVVSDVTIDDILEDINDDPNPEFTIGLYDGEGSTTGDPCSPAPGDPAPGDPAAGDPAAEGEAAEGEAGGECPDGIRSAIFAFTREPALELTVQAYPPETEAAAETNPYGPIWCAPETLGTGDAMIGILANKPADITLSVINTTPPNDNTTYSVPRDAEEEHAWNEAFAAASFESQVPPLVYCVVVHDLASATSYIAQASAIEPSGEVVTAQTTFNSDGTPTRPVAQFFTLGDNYIFASALRPADQNVVFRAWYVNGLDVEPDCSAPDGTPVSAIAGRETHLEPETLAALNVYPDYDTRTSVVFRIPEGSTLLTCVRWYPRAMADPSWVRDQPVWQSERIFGAPDRIMPVVTINPDMTGGLRDPAGVDRVSVTVATAEGIECGRATLFTGGETIRAVRSNLCDTSVLTLGGARNRDNSLFWDVGFSGDLSFTVTTTLTNGETDDSVWVLPSSEQTCWGTCALPATTGFVVPIPAVHHVFDCGESTPFRLSRQPCIPVPQPDDGWIGIQVNWVQGQQNGVGRDWRESSGPDGGREYVRPDIPQLDTTKALSAGEVDSLTHTGSGSFLLVADRRVTYSATILDINGGEACVDGPEGSTIVRTVSGRNAVTFDPIEVRFDHLCLGRLYTVQVSLRDNHDMTSLWGISGPQRWPSPRSVFAVGGVLVPTFTEWQIEVDDPDLRVGNVHATYGRQPITMDRAGTCLSTNGRAASAGRTYDDNDRRLGTWSTLHITYWVTATSGNPADVGCANGHVVEARTIDVPVHLGDVIDNTDGYQNVIITDGASTAVTFRLTIGQG